jgi:hypothetical protein
MKKFHVIFLVLMLAFLSSCCWLGGSGRKIVTTSDNISSTYMGCVEPFPNDQLPAPLQERWSDQMVLMVDDNALKSPEAVHGILSSDGRVTGDGGDVYLEGLWELAKTFFPGLLAFEGVAALLIRRKRRHYVSAIKNLVPYDGVVDVKEAVTDVGRALGLAHSSPTTKEIFESEVASNKGNPTPS